MTHVRKQIRDRVASVLASGVTLVSGRVYQNRVYPLHEAQLPAITVYSGSETVEPFTMGNMTASRVVEINVDIYNAAVTALDDAIDAIAVQVETAIGNDFTVNGLAKSITLQSVALEYSGDAQTPLGVARLVYAAHYVTSISDAETAR